MKKKILFGIVSLCAAAALSFGVFALALPDKTEKSQPEASSKDVQEPVTTISQMKMRVANDRSVTKSNMFYKMLNSVDYYQTVSGSFKAPDLGVGDSTVEYRVDVMNQESYQRITDAGADEEQYVKDGMKTIYDNKARTYHQAGVPVYAEDLQTLRSQSRITEDEQGESHYQLRGDLTHTGIAASLSLLPQQLAFAFLEDFDNWEIKGTETFLGREAVRIEGKADAYFNDKLSVERFVFLVDRDTGILLNYDGYAADGSLVDFMHTNSIAVDQPVNMDTTARCAKYAGYTQQ